MKKNILLSSLLAVGVSGALLFVDITPVEAATSETKYPSLIQALIDKFKLNKTEVETVITEERTTRQNERKAQMEEKLNQAVKDGKINEEVKNAVLKMINEHQAERAALNETMRNKIDEHRSEMQQLEEKYGIDLQEILGYGGGYGMGEGRGMGRGMGRW